MDRLLRRQLELWGEWWRRESAFGAGSGASPLYAIIRQGAYVDLGRRDDFEPDYALRPEQTEAVRVELLVQNMAVRRGLTGQARALRLKYQEKMTETTAAQQIGKSRAAYRMIVREGEAWIGGALFGVVGADGRLVA